MALSQGDLQGIYCAMVTPTDADGRVDRDSVKRLVAYLIDAGTSGLVPVGGTGEYTALSPRERRAMVEATVEAAAGRVPVVAGVLSPGYAEAVAAGRDFAACGADALLLITPFYATPTQAGVRDYYKAYVGAVDLPLLLYEIPARTGVALDPETIAGMVDDGTIVGMKACNTNLSQFIRVMAAVGGRMAVLGGEEPYFATHVAMGASGGILASANLVPRLWQEIYRLAASGDLRGALVKQAELEPLLQAIFCETNPGPLKCAMTMAGYAVGEAMLPLSTPRAESLARLEPAVAVALERERGLGAPALGATA